MKWSYGPRFFVRKVGFKTKENTDTEELPQIGTERNSTRTIISMTRKERASQ